MEEQPVEEFVFENMDEFYNYISASPILHQSPKFYVFYNVYTEMIKGCKCAKKQRGVEAKAAYLEMANLEMESYMALKQGIYCIKLKFKHNGNVFAEF